MLKTLIEKELKAIILSPKFAATFAVCALLIVLSVFVGIKEYNNAVAQYETVTSLAEQELREQNSWSSLGTRISREPEPMQIFSSGVHNDVGRLTAISSWQEIKLRNSNYSDDPIFAVFRFVDVAFIVQIVLSLFAILFTYDAINGEREGGTLQLTFSNAVPRVQYIVSKFIGSWLGLVLPLLVPILLGLLLLLLFNVPLTGDDWGKMTAMMGASLLYFTFFIALGILVSALTKQSATSFLFLLVTWVTLVLIIPRVGVMAAGHLYEVPTVAEVEAKRDGFAKDKWEEHFQGMEDRWSARNVEMQGMDESEREEDRDDNEWGWMQEDAEERKKVTAEISDYGRKLTEDLRNRKAEQEKFGFTISRFSPASAFQLAVMNLAGTNIDLKTRNEDAMDDYRTAFKDYRDKKQKENGGGGGIRISMSSGESGGAFKISGDRDQGTLDLTDMPKFVAPQHTFSAGFSPAMTDIGLLSLFTIIAFAAAFVAFLKYDVR